jgi:hypothetical protein
MFSFYIHLLMPLVSILFYRLDGHNITYKAITDNYEKWTDLKSLVSTNQKNKAKVIYICFKMIGIALWISFLQYINTSVKKLDRNIYEMRYVVNGRLYKMVVIPKRGPTPVLQISNDEDIDVTSQILPYMGPQYDWHNNKLTPKFFNYKTLTFQLSDGTEYTVKEDIQINKN